MTSRFERDYVQLLTDALIEGVERKDRTGVGTRALFGKMLEVDLREGFPILTIRKQSIKPAAGELAAFLEGSTDLRRFKELGCHWWEANVSAKHWQNNPNCKGPNDLGKVYGALWRDFNGVDQLQEAVWKIKNNPTDRRIVVTGWDPSLMDKQCLPPCHLFFQFFVHNEDELSLAFYMRSVDLYLGLPADIILYSLLLSIVANQTDRKPRYVKAFLGDTHLYSNHVEQALILRDREAFNLPTLNLWNGATIDNFHPEMVHLENYRYNPPLTAEMAV
jgi:thymidylate synthase